jgi:HEPN domain-containing protein
MKRRIVASSSMSEGDAPARRSEAGRWLGVAAEDSRVARACLDIDPPELGIAAYLCQQAAEKILKGMLIVAEVEFTLTHDLERLTALAEPHYPDVRRLFDEVRSLTPWNTAYRYPGPDPVPEPLPSATKINQVLATIERLAARLRLQLGN